jgi:hypothetical protein
VRRAGSCPGPIDGLRPGTRGLPGIPRRLRINHRGEKFGLHELIHALQTLAFAAIAANGAALVIQQHFQVESKLAHDL